MTTISFAEWRPDVADLNSNFTKDVMNVLCADGSYLPFPQLSPIGGTALSDDPLGFFMARDDAGQYVIFAGTAAKLWRYDNTAMSWVDISRTVGAYNATDIEPWSFAQYGTNVVAVNANDAPQVFDLSLSSEFSNLAGSPPHGRYIAVWGDFLVIGGLTDFPRRVHWSALNNITIWTPGTNNCDYQDFPDGGVVTGLTSATNPLIFQETSIRRGIFMPGSVEVFSFDKLHDQRGAKAPYGLTYRGNYVFFVDHGGFFQIDYGGQLTPIGYEKVDRSVFDAATDISQIQGAVDPFHSRVYWAIKTDGSEFFNRILIYDWNLTRWSQSNLETKGIIPAATIGYTLEGLDSVSSSLDALPFSLDSKVWQAGSPVLAAFDPNNRFCFFAGDEMEATFTTQEIGDVGAVITQITSVYPIIDTDQARISYGSRYRRHEPPTWTEEARGSANTGIVRKRARARFHRFKVRIPADTEWSHAQGLEVDSQTAGQR